MVYFKAGQVECPAWIKENTHWNTTRNNRLIDILDRTFPFSLLYVSPPSPFFLKHVQIFILNIDIF